MSAALCALYDMVKADPGSYKNLVPSFVSILKQVAESRLPSVYNYHKTPAPFVQVDTSTPSPPTATSQPPPPPPPSPIPR